MIYLLLSILSSIGIFIAFRMFSGYEVHTRHGIMINYLVAGLTGVLAFQPDLSWFTSDWFWPSSLLGVLFYVIFRVMARVTQQNGMAISSLATKMSVVIPVTIGLLFLQESLSWLKMIGVILGLVSIILSAGGSVERKDMLWPLILFAGSGVIDASLKLFQHFLVPEGDFPMFISNIFFAAFLSALIHHLFTSERKIRTNAWVGGLGLGLVNFAALYFILRSLAIPAWESSVVFPINNFGIIAGSTLLAVFALGERINTRGWIAFATASASIVILYISQ